jgi:hypothetical protein
VIETPDDDDVFAAKADHGRELPHPVVHCSSVADGFAAEDVGIEDRDRVCHMASVRV